MQRGQRCVALTWVACPSPEGAPGQVRCGSHRKEPVVSSGQRGRPRGAGGQEQSATGDTVPYQGTAAGGPQLENR